MRRFALVVPAVVVLGCGAHDPKPAAACTRNPATIERAALRAGALPDGTHLSTCVSDARGDADLERVALAFTSAADDLALRAVHDPRAAHGLGYLIGAAQRDGGGAAELVRRLAAAQRGVHEAEPAMDSAVERGRADGRAHG